MKFIVGGLLLGLTGLPPRVEPDLAGAGFRMEVKRGSGLSIIGTGGKRAAVDCPDIVLPPREWPLYSDGSL